MKLRDFNNRKIRSCCVGEEINLLIVLQGELSQAKSTVLDIEYENSEVSSVLLKPEDQMLKGRLLCIDLKKEDVEFVRVH